MRDWRFWFLGDRLFNLSVMKRVAFYRGWITLQAPFDRLRDRTSRNPAQRIKNAQIARF